MKSLRLLPVLLALALPLAAQQPSAPEEPASIFGERSLVVMLAYSPLLGAVVVASLPVIKRTT